MRWPKNRLEAVSSRAILCIDSETSGLGSSFLWKVIHQVVLLWGRLHFRLLHQLIGLLVWLLPNLHQGHKLLELSYRNNASRCFFMPSCKALTHPLHQVACVKVSCCLQGCNDVDWRIPGASRIGDATGEVDVARAIAGVCHHYNLQSL